MLKIIEDHWSTNLNDSHQLDDEDCTYGIVDSRGIMLEIFTKLETARKFINFYHASQV